MKALRSPEGIDKSIQLKESTGLIGLGGLALIPGPGWMAAIAAGGYTGGKSYMEAYHWSGKAREESAQTMGRLFAGAEERVQELDVFLPYLSQ